MTSTLQQVMRGIEPFLAQALEKIEQLKDQQAVRSRALEETIVLHRDDMRKMAAEDADVSGSHVASGRQGEPIQLTGGVLSMAALQIGQAPQAAWPASEEHTHAFEEQIWSPGMAMSRTSAAVSGCPRVDGIPDALLALACAPDLHTSTHSFDNSAALEYHKSWQSLMGLT